MRTILVIFLLTTIWTASNGQQRKPSKRKVEASRKYDKYNDSNSDFLFRFDAGVFIPIDNLKKTLNTSFQTALYFGAPINDKFRIDLGASLFFPHNSQTVDYFLPDTTLTGKLNLGITMGVWGTHHIRLSEKYCLDNRIGTGVGSLATNIKTNKPKSENNNYYSADTMFLNFGTNFRRILQGGGGVGLSFNYYIVPYNAFKERLASDIGMQYATMSLSFSW